MAAIQLTPYLLESSVIEYTTAITSEALRSHDLVVQQKTKRMAMYALQFFLDILDPSVEEERRQLDTFRSYHAALNDCLVDEEVAKGLPISTDRSIGNPEPKVFNLTPAQLVLSLPDTLDTIFGHLPLQNQSDRDTFRNAALTSRALYHVAQRRLWRRPRDLDTVERQLRFAFGMAISGAGGDSLGQYVKRLHIQTFKGAWNARLVQKIVTLTPGVVGMSLHWGDSVDDVDDVTSSVLVSIRNILSSLPNLKHLHLQKSTYTPDPDEQNVQLPTDAHIPFTKLESLQLRDFHWYWEPIQRGLGPALKVLNIGYGTFVSGDNIVNLSPKLTSLTTLRVESSIEVHHIRSLVHNLPQLEHVKIHNYTMTLVDEEKEYVTAAIPLLARLERLKGLSFNRTIGSIQLKVLADSPGPLEVISLELKLDSEIANRLDMLLNAKRKTLKRVRIHFDGNALTPSDKVVDILASTPHLERILIDFQPIHKLSSSSVNKLLKQCPKLEWTNSLKDLVAGSSLYKKKYKARLERERDEETNAMEGDILGNWW